MSLEICLGTSTVIGGARPISDRESVFIGRNQRATGTVMGN